MASDISGAAGDKHGVGHKPNFIGGLG